MNFKKRFKLNLKVFFFNSKTDYLPYYKHFSFILEKDKDLNLKDILKLIKSENENFAFPNNRELLFRINGLVVNGKEKLSDVTKQLGYELTVDPVLKYRSKNCLVIDNSDFLHQFRRTIGHFSKKDDLMFYLKLYGVHYASETFRYNKEYIGDAILILAHKMLKDGNPHSKEIIDAISGEFNGIDWCEYQNNLFNGQDYSKEISELKDIVYSGKRSKSIGSTCSKFIKKRERVYEIGSIENKNIALYLGGSKNLLDRAKSKLVNRRAKYISFGMENRLAGQTILDKNPKFAYKKAGELMLEAFDSGVDILAIVNRDDYNYFKRVHNMAEKEVGREINLNLMKLDV
jgi:hypothetical protein